MRVLTLMAILLSLFVAVPAQAEEGSCGGCLTGFGCDNACPLAQQANAWRAAGAEALAVRCRVQGEHAAAVTKNLGRI